MTLQSASGRPRPPTTPTTGPCHLSPEEWALIPPPHTPRVVAAELVAQPSETFLPASGTGDGDSVRRGPRVRDFPGTPSRPRPAGDNGRRFVFGNSGWISPARSPVGLGCSPGPAGRGASGLACSVVQAHLTPFTCHRWPRACRRSPGNDLRVLTRVMAGAGRGGTDGRTCGRAWGEHCPRGLSGSSAPPPPQSLCGQQAASLQWVLGPRPPLRALPQL